MQQDDHLFRASSPLLECPTQFQVQKKAANKGLKLQLLDICRFTDDRYRKRKNKIDICNENCCCRESVLDESVHIMFRTDQRSSELTWTL